MTLGWKEIVLLAAVLAVVGYLWLRRTGDIQTDEARQLVESGALLVDVRTPEEFASGHIEGALNIPLQELTQRIQEFGAKNQSIVLYCRSGNRSAQAQRRLRDNGFESVYNLGAMSSW